MGEGHTLTRANQMIVGELPWTWKDLDQMEGRIHRMTQTRPTRVVYPIFDRSLEVRMLTLIIEKMRGENAVLN